MDHVDVVRQKKKKKKNIYIINTTVQCSNLKNRVVAGGPVPRGASTFSAMKRESVFCYFAFVYVIRCWINK